MWKSGDKGDRSRFSRTIPPAPLASWLTALPLQCRQSIPLAARPPHFLSLWEITFACGKLQCIVYALHKMDKTSETQQYIFQSLWGLRRFTEIERFSISPIAMFRTYIIWKQEKNLSHLLHYITMHWRMIPFDWCLKVFVKRFSPNLHLSFYKCPFNLVSFSSILSFLFLCSSTSFRACQISFTESNAEFICNIADLHVIETAYSVRILPRNTQNIFYRIQRMLRFNP